MTKAVRKDGLAEKKRQERVVVNEDEVDMKGTYTGRKETTTSLNSHRTNSTVRSPFAARCT